MANNFKSIQQPFTTANQTIDLVTCSVSAIIVSKVQINILPEGSGKFHLLLTKSGAGTVKLGTEKFPSSVDDMIYELIDKAVILENGDTLTGQTVGSGTTVQCTVHYMEKTADVATSDIEDLSNVDDTTPTDGQALIYDGGSGKWQPQSLGDASGVSDTSDLPQQSSGAEPWNRYMKSFNGLTTLTNITADLPHDVLKNAPTDIVMVACNTGLTGFESQPLKFTFGDMIQALLSGALSDLIADPNSPVSESLVTGSGGLGDLDDDGAVGSSDLLDFLSVFGYAWGDTNSNMFRSSRVRITTTSPTSIQGTFQTLGFQLADIETQDPGSQDLTVDATNNLIKIQSPQTVGSYPLYAVPTKYLEIGNGGGIAFTGATFVAGDRIKFQALVKLYDEDDNQLGNDVLGDMGTFTGSAAGIYQSDGHQVTITTAQVETASGHTNGWNADDFDYLTVEIQAFAISGSATAVINACTIRLKQ